MKRHIVLPMLAMVGLAMLVSSFAVTITSVFAQDTPYSEDAVIAVWYTDL